MSTKVICLARTADILSTAELQTGTRSCVMGHKVAYCFWEKCSVEQGVLISQLFREVGVTEKIPTKALWKSHALKAPRVRTIFKIPQKKIRNIYSVRDKKKIWKLYVLTEEKLKETGAGIKKNRRNLLRLLAVHSGVSSPSAKLESCVRWDGAGYRSPVVILETRELLAPKI